MRRFTIARSALPFFGWRSWSAISPKSPTGHTLETIHTTLKAHPALIQRSREYATQWSLDREQQTLALMEAGKAQFTPINATPELPEGLSAYQKAAVQRAATTTDQFIGWIGVAGAGKTYTVKALKEIATTAEIDILGLAPDASAAITLGEEAQLQAPDGGLNFCIAPLFPVKDANCGSWMKRGSYRPRLPMS